jgi:chromosome segregation ATPase
MTNQEALAQVKGIFPAVVKLPEIFDAAIAADKQVHELDATKAKLETYIERLQREATDVESATASVRERLGTFQSDLGTKNQKLVELDTAIAAKEAELALARDAFEQFKKTHLQMT